MKACEPDICVNVRAFHFMTGDNAESVSCIAAKLRRRKFYSSAVQISNKLECGQMPNVMVALPNTGGAICSTPQSLADAHYWSAVQ